MPKSRKRKPPVRLAGDPPVRRRKKPARKWPIEGILNVAAAVINFFGKLV